jgi:DNA repair protein RadC
MTMKRVKRRSRLADARLGPKPTLAPYGLGAATTTCAPITASRAVRVCITRPERPGKPLRSSADVCQLLRGAANADREGFYAIHLDAGNREELAKGAVDWVMTTPRETFKAAMIGNASAIILAHNHPSGNTEPSQADLDLTKRLIEVGKLVDVPVRDHVIFTGGGCRSLRDMGTVQGFGATRGRRYR